MSDQERGYEHSSPLDSRTLKVDTIHTIHYEQYGKIDGKPVIFVHGGPGGSTSKANTVYFNPEVYRVVLFDQRGAGKSTPSGELRENTTHHLVADIETLRTHLGIEKWHLVFGGSWGSALSLIYAQAHPDSVGSMILRGVYACRKSELGWSRGNNGDGAGRLYPDLYESFLGQLPHEDRSDPIAGYYKLFTSNDRTEKQRLTAAREWNRWDLTLCSLKPDYAKLDDDKWVMEHALLETHYHSHRGWIEDGQLLRSENIDRIRHIPTTIVQGRYDIITPPKTAWDLHKVWPESKLYWVATAGHSVKDPGMQAKLVESCDEHARL